MNDTTDAFELHEEDLFATAVSDEALEAAACAGTENARAAFTAALCTVMADCSS